MKLLILAAVICSILFSYTNEDWKVYNGCKDKVYENKSNEYDYDACKEMLDHKSALKKYGAESSYNYWLERLGKK